jgi:hypothetical protein
MWRLGPYTARRASLWTSETAEDFRLEEALDRSAPCPWLLWTAKYVDVDAVDNDDSEAMVELERCYRKFRKGN